MKNKFIFPIVSMLICQFALAGEIKITAEGKLKGTDVIVGPGGDITRIYHCKGSRGTCFEITITVEDEMLHECKIISDPYEETPEISSDKISNFQPFPMIRSSKSYVNNNGQNLTEMEFQLLSEEEKEEIEIIYRFVDLKSILNP